MCGITGYYTKNEVKEDVLSKMAQTIIHRGPDSGGVFVSKNKRLGFGFRRLAIIDLSPLGNQPMKSPCSETWIIFNGEIYNFQELRKELEAKKHIFRSHSDTEVMLHLWEEMGPKLVEKLNGMFAIAIWDEQKQTLFLARDHIGIKPLYWTLQNNNFVFGSEIKAILAHPAVKKELNEEGLNYYLTFACAPSPYTLFKGINKLEAGHYLLIDKNLNIQEFEYWDPIAGAKNKEFRIKNSEEAERYFIEKTRGILQDSIQMQMVSDVPFGCYLSGGIDSSTNAILMSKAMGAPVETFSIGFKDFEKYNELGYSRQVAEILGSKCHEILIGQKDFFDWLAKYAFHADDPNGDPVCLPVFYVSKLIRDSGVIMAQVGEGADELFSGYGTYLAYFKIYKKFWSWAQKLPSFFKKAGYYSAKKAIGRRRNSFIYLEHLRRLKDNQELFWGGAVAFGETQKEKLLSKEFKNKNLPDAYNLIKSYYQKIDALGEFDFLQRLVYLELKIRLPELLLMRVDKMAMANSIEARVPFLDKRLVELAMQIPMNLKLKNYQTKYILKQAVKGIVPDNIINRKKQGFGTPLAEWLKVSEFNKEIKQKITASKIHQRNMFNKQYVNELFENHFSGAIDNSTRIWNLLSLSLWYEQWFY